MNRKFDGRKFLVALISAALFTGLTSCSDSGRQSSNSFKSNEAVLSEIQSRLGALSSTVKISKMDLWWVTRDGYNIINDNSPGLEAQYPQCVNDDSNFTKWKAMAKKTVTSVDAVMLAEGFKVDVETNSSASLSDTKFYDYIKAYYRGDTKAVLSISPDCGSTQQTDNPVMYYSATFGYTDEYQKNYDSQISFLKDLKLKDVIVHVIKSDGQYRLLAINYRRSGHASIVKQVNGQWTEMWSGQDLISCALRDKKKIPLSMAPDCYDY